MNYLIKCNLNENLKSDLIKLLYNFDWEFINKVIITGSYNRDHCIEVNFDNNTKILYIDILTKLTSLDIDELLLKINSVIDKYRVYIPIKYDFIDKIFKPVTKLNISNEVYYWLKSDFIWNFNPKTKSFWIKSKDGSMLHSVQLPNGLNIWYFNHKSNLLVYQYNSGTLTMYLDTDYNFYKTYKIKLK